MCAMLQRSEICTWIDNLEHNFVKSKRFFSYITENSKPALMG